MIWCLILLDTGSWNSAVLSLSLSVAGMSFGKALDVRTGLEDHPRYPVLVASIMVVEAIIFGFMGCLRLRRGWIAARRTRVGVVRSEYSDDAQIGGVALDSFDSRGLARA